MVLSGVLLSLVARDFGFTVRMRHDLDLLAETQQGLQASLSEITRELRQAGACLPTSGAFVALGGADDGERDTLTVRVGRVNPANVVCVRTILTEKAQTGLSSVTVENADGFAVDELVYLTRSNGSGQTLRVAGVGANSLSLAGTLDGDYAAGDGVFALEERTYAVDDTGATPMLTVAIDGGEPQPVVDGVETFDVQYLLAPCSPCQPVGLPASDAEWHQVREITVAVGVVSEQPGGGGQLVRLSGSTNIKPRNLL